MKRLLAVSLALCATGFVSLAVAQGTVRFNSSNSSLVFQFMDATGSSYMAVPSGQGFVQLAYAPIATAYSPYTPGQTATAWIAANPGWTLGPIAPIGPEAGHFDGGIATLAGVAAGTYADYVVLGWTGTQPTFDAALEASFQVGVVGVSQQVFTTPTGGLDPLVPPPSISSTFSGGIIGVQLPEPSAVSLAALGALILFLRSRR